MSEPAYVEPDEHGHIYVRIGGEAKVFSVEGPDADGQYWLAELLPLPAELEELFAEQDRHPDRMVRRSVRG